jgi:hypothetical protein
MVSGTNIETPGAGNLITLASYTLDNNTIASVAFAGCSGGTWTGGSGTHYAVYNATYGGGIAWAYNLGNGGGCTSVTVTMTSAETSSGWTLAYDEWNRGGGSPTFDAFSSTNANTTSCTSCSGSAFSGLTGTSDVLIQVIADGSSTGAPSTPYVWDTDEFIAYALNSTQTTAPTWTQSGGGFLSLGAAFK